jgi:TonB-linked SusC/RagA family outer membrane protein
MNNTIKWEHTQNSILLEVPGANVLRIAGHTIFLLLLSAFFACISVIPTQAQKTQIYEGVVVESNDRPIAGATVTVAGTLIGTITDSDGKFSIAVPDEGKVVVSFVGYISQTVTDFKNPRIVLKEDLLKLDEVVVVGYGQQKMRNVTGAIATVAPREISDLSVGNLGVALNGMINGLSITGGDGRPGEQASLIVRQSDVTSSYSSVSGYVPENMPLYVIDGYLTQDESVFNNLDISEVENITVLKDAAAAVYGARSAQGVILVKTKRGQVGAPKISYNGQLGYTDEIARPKMLNAYDYGVLWNAVAAARTTNNTLDPAQDLFQYDELAAMRKLNYDLLDKEWSAALTQKHSVNVSGGSERATYFANMSYYTQDGNLGRIDYDRWNYRAGVDAQIGKSLKASLQVSGDYGKRNTALNKVGGTSGETDYYSLLTRPRYMPDYINGMPVAALGVSNTMIDEIQYYHFGAIQQSNNYSKNNSENMFINSSLEYDFGWNKMLKGLKVKVSYSKRINTAKTNQLGSKYTVYRMADRGTGGNGSSATGHLFTGDDIDLSSENLEAISVENGSEGSFISRKMERSASYQLNFIATYARKFGLHDVSALFTIEKSEAEMEDVTGTVKNPLSFTDGQSNSASGTQSTSFNRTESGILSYVGRVNYSYADRYLLEFLVRTDASTKFAPENYWGVFPSLSAGWVVSEENWFEKGNGIDFLKIRGSAGLLGRDNIKPWGWVQFFGIGANKGAIFGTNPGASLGSAISSSEAPNRDAHWDKSYKTNFGIDMRTFRDRFSVNLDGYYEFNRDIFMTRQGASDFPSTVGTKPTAENYGSIDTYGLELSLGWQDRIGKDFKYYIKLNTGYEDNKVKEMPWPSLITIDKVHPGQRNDVGDWGLECIGMFRSYQEIEEYFDKYHITNYLSNTKENVHPGMLIYNDVRGPQNEDGSYQEPDGVIDRTVDIVKISHRDNPYGFTVNLGGEWKGLSFSAQVNANWGGYSFVPSTARGIENLISSGGEYTDMEYTSLPSFWANNMFIYEDVVDAGGQVVAAQNHDAKYPNLRYSLNQENSTFWKVSGTRVTLRNVTLAYTLPNAWVNAFGLSSCRFNITGQNMLSFFNPYPDKFTDPMAGIYGNYPNLRRITLGINVSF